MNRQPRVLFGVLRCIVCKLEWSANWVLYAGDVYCHHCGVNPAIPVGPQVPVAQAPNFTDGVEWQLTRRQVTRLRS